MLTAIELRERLQYDPNTGYWVWLKTPRAGFIGKPAGSLDAKGYWVIKIDGQSYKASRLAFLYMTGEWPPDEMDHADTKPWNDAWCNLRPATRLENIQNRQMRSDNPSGAIGVKQHFNKWQVRVDNVYYGLFDSFEEAVAVRDSIATEVHGEFVALNSQEK